MKHRRSLTDREPVASTIVAAADATDWRAELPTLTGSLIVLRELRASDAPSLAEALSADDVSRFISPAPTTPGGFETFIAQTHRQRAAGEHVCFGVVPRGCETAIGLFQVRSIEAGFAAAEWGFAIAPEFRGTGVFSDGASLVIDFAFAMLGARRLEARAAVENGRAHGALLKVGAVCEAVLRRASLRAGQYRDEALWAIVADEWYDGQASRNDSAIH
jgi:RimJ/RimL family protein N-acetyltransferase